MTLLEVGLRPGTEQGGYPGRGVGPVPQETLAHTSHSITPVGGIHPSGTVTFLFTDVGLYVTALAGVEILPHFRSAWHLEHHAKSDREGDPHSPLDGFWHANIGWIIRATPAKRERYCEQLRDDPVVVLVDRTT
jgi:hypothetical protein